MDTRDLLLTHATELVRTRGYNGFSYADLAAVIGIRKASIHHHFPTKADLGIAIVETYSDAFRIALEAISTNDGEALEQLRQYVNLYRQSLVGGMGCLCGTLASEIDVVPPAVGEGVKQFMDMNLRWIHDVLRRGQETGEIRGEHDPDAASRLLLSICQGALLVFRVRQDVASFDRAVDSVFSRLTAI